MAFLVGQALRRGWVGLVLLCGAGSFSVAAAPFEGLMHFVVSHYGEGGKALERSLVRVMATPERILIPDMRNIGSFAANAPGGVDSILVRNDEKDILVFGDAIDAYWFKSYELRFLGLAMKSMPADEMPVDLGEPRYAGRFRLRNLDARLWRYEGEGGIRVDLYLSDQYKVNWGLVGGSWLFGSGGLSISGLDSFFAEGLVPARMEVFEGGAKRMSVNLMKVEAMPIDRRSMAKPNGKILHSTKDVLMDFVGW